MRLGERCVCGTHHLICRYDETISRFCTNAQKNGKIGLKSCHFHTLQLYLDKVIWTKEVGNTQRGNEEIEMEFSLDSLQPKERASFALRALYEAAGCRKYHMGRFEEYGL